MEWLLVLVIFANNKSSMIAVKIPDKQSCIQAGKQHQSVFRDGYYTCTQIKKEIK